MGNCHSGITWTNISKRYLTVKVLLPLRKKGTRPAYRGAATSGSSSSRQVVSLWRLGLGPRAEEVLASQVSHTRIQVLFTVKGRPTCLDRREAAGFFRILAGRDCRQLDTFPQSLKALLRSNVLVDQQKRALFFSGT